MMKVVGFPAFGTRWLGFPGASELFKRFQIASRGALLGNLTWSLVMSWAMREQTLGPVNGILWEAIGRKIAGPLSSL